MKKHLLGMMGIFIFFSCFLAATSVLASGRTGFIDMREIMVNSDAGRRAADEFKKAFEKERDLIQARENELKKMKDELDKQRSVLTESALRDREIAYQRRLRDYQILVRDSNEALQMRDQELTKALLPEVMKVVNAIGEREKFTMIIDVSTVPVVYYARELDITKRVIDELNRVHKPPRR